MKKFSTLLIAALTTLSIAATEPLQTTPEKQAKFIQVANEVATRLAPDYDLTNLHPVVFLVDDLPQKTDDDQIIMVCFMPDTTQNGYTQLTYFDKTKKELAKTDKRPKFDLLVQIRDNTFAPEGIMGNNGIGLFFNPSYEEFLKDNPDFKVKKEPKKKVERIF